MFLNAIKMQIEEWLNIKFYLQKRLLKLKYFF